MGWKGNGAIRNDGTSSGQNAIICGRHSWHLESLRGTNCNQRVEHLRCLLCNRRRTRVWTDLPKQGSPDRQYPRAA